MSHNCLMSHLHRLINNCSFFFFFCNSPLLCRLLPGLAKLVVSRSRLAQISHFIPWMLSLTLTRNIGYVTTTGVANDAGHNAHGKAWSWPLLWVSCWMLKGSSFLLVSGGSTSRLWTAAALRPIYHSNLPANLLWMFKTHHCFLQHLACHLFSKSLSSAAQFNYLEKYKRGVCGDVCKGKLFVKALHQILPFIVGVLEGAVALQKQGGSDHTNKTLWFPISTVGICREQSSTTLRSHTWGITQHEPKASCPDLLPPLSVLSSLRIVPPVRHTWTCEKVSARFLIFQTHHPCSSQMQWVSQGWAARHYHVGCGNWGRSEEPEGRCVTAQTGHGPWLINHSTLDSSSSFFAFLPLYFCHWHSGQFNTRCLPGNSGGRGVLWELHVHQDVDRKFVTIQPDLIGMMCKKQAPQIFLVLLNLSGADL